MYDEIRHKLNLRFFTQFVDIIAFKDAISVITLVMKGTLNWSVLLKKIENGWSSSFGGNKLTE